MKDAGGKSEKVAENQAFCPTITRQSPGNQAATSRQLPPRAAINPKNRLPQLTRLNDVYRT